MTFNSADPNRSKEDSNPFTFYQRLSMIERSLLISGWRQEEFVILPTDIANSDALISLPALLPDPSQTVVLATIYDKWGEEKIARMSQLGFRVEVLWRRTMAERVTSGAEIRNLMATGNDWVNLVPAGVAEALSPSFTTQN